MTTEDSLQQKGWARLPYQFEPHELDALSSLNPHIGRGQRLTDMPALASALPPGFNTALSEFGFNPAPLRAVGFHKSADANWSLPWHQDRVVAMPHKSESPDLKNWSRKSGVWHCEPSAEILAQMGFAYIAFDDINGERGGLEIAEATHKFGALAEADIQATVHSAAKVCPNMREGDVLLVSALTLHRSAALKMGGPRKTLRVDFGAAALNLST